MFNRWIIIVEEALNPSTFYPNWEHIRMTDLFLKMSWKLTLQFRI